MMRFKRSLAVALLLFAPKSASAAIAIDVNISRDLSTASTTMTTPAFSTAAGNELLLAFISTDYLGGPNTTVQSVAGAGLSWVLVVRTNAQSGSSEIWRAFSPSPLTNVSVTATLSQSTVSSLTVMSFTGVTQRAPTVLGRSARRAVGAPLPVAQPPRWSPRAATHGCLGLVTITTEPSHGHPGPGKAWCISTSRP